MNRREFLKKSVKTGEVVAAVSLGRWPDNPESEVEDLGDYLVPDDIQARLMAKLAYPVIAADAAVGREVSRTVYWQTGGVADFNDQVELTFHEILGR